MLFFLGLGPLICVAAVLVDASEAAVYVACVGLVTIGWVVWQLVVLDIYAPLAHIPLTLLSRVDRPRTRPIPCPCPRSQTAIESETDRAEQGCSRIDDGNDGRDEQQRHRDRHHCPERTEDDRHSAVSAIRRS